MNFYDFGNEGGDSGAGEITSGGGYDYGYDYGTDQTDYESLLQNLLAEQAAAEQAAAERAAAEQAAAEQAAAEKAAAEKAEAERVEAERAEAERIERERIAAEKAAAERAEAERVERERIAAEKAAAEKAAAEKAERERVAAEAAAEAKRLEEEAAAARGREKERLEKEAAAAKAEAERLEKEHIAAEKEAARVEAERVERERVAAERAAAERAAAEKAAAERAAAEKAEADRVEKERVAAEQAAAEKAATEKAAAEKAEAERVEQNRVAAEKAAAEQQKREQAAAEAAAEAERLKAAAAEAAGLESLRLEKEAAAAAAEAQKQKQAAAEAAAQEEKRQAELQRQTEAQRQAEVQRQIEQQRLEETQRSQASSVADTLINNDTKNKEAIEAKDQYVSDLQKRNQETAAAKEKSIAPLLKQLGGDSPQNRAIAEGLQKQGISSIKDIGVKKVEKYHEGSEGNDQSGAIPSYTTIENEYFNKSNDQKIDPNRLGIIQNGQSGVEGGDIFFNLTSDANGNVSFQPQWSPRAHGFLRDSGVGQLIMKAGAIIPNPFQLGFVAANTIDAAMHDKWAQVVANLLPYGLQELATAGNLADLAGNPDFVSSAKTAAGKIAEAIGAPSEYADSIGKAGLASLKAGITGGDIGKALLMSQLSSKNFLKDAGDFSKGIAGLDIGDETDFSKEALDELNNLIDLRADENGLGDDLAIDTRADENGLGNDLINNNATTEKPWYESGTNESVEPEGGWKGEGWGTIGEDDPNQLPTVTVGAKTEPYEPEDGWEGEGWGTIGEGESGDEIDLTAPLELPPGAEPDEEKPKEPYRLNPDTVQLDRVVIRPKPGDESDPDYVTPPGQGMVDDTWTNDHYVTPPGQGMVDDTWTKEGIPEEPAKEPTKETTDKTDDTVKIPPIFPSKEPTTKPPIKPIIPSAGLDGLAGLLLGNVIGKNTDVDPKIGETPIVNKTYKFDWNKQPIQNPVNGVAYGQKFYGNHWTQPQETTMTKDYAEGGLMSLDKTMGSPMFKPTIGDGGIQANELSNNHIVDQALQHLRRGGHVIDRKMHSEVGYLAKKGEPVHHIVGFMNHQKRMAEGGITSYSLGSYSDGGHFLKGPGDGMSDDIPATIADKHPARLANEEFVIPADVVSHLGNGSSESGAKVLYDMMAKIRKARTGNPKQGKQIDAHKFMPKV
jgi:hypothetical protein